QVVSAAVQEDANAVAISSYQGGHVEYFSYLVEQLAARGAGHVRVYGGGGGVIGADEVAGLRERGVTIFRPEDGQQLGLVRMVNRIVAESDVDLGSEPPQLDAVLAGEQGAVARALTVLESGEHADLVAALRTA